MIFRFLFGVVLAFGAGNAIAQEKSFVGSDHAEYTTTNYAVPFATGLKLPDAKHKALTPTAIPKFYDGELPKSFDWREKGITPIRDQGPVGTCWAFSTMATIADNILLSGVNGYEDLSEQFRVAHDKTNGNGGTSGGYIHQDFAAQFGSMLEKDCPYTASNARCAKTTPTYFKLVKWGWVESDDSVPSVEKLKRAIYTYGPISVAVAANNAFMSYSSGIFNGPTSNSINHAVNLVGWNDDGQYWIMRNSWSKNWGEAGFMKIRYGTNLIGFGASFVSYDGKERTPVDPTPPPPPPPPPGPDPVNPSVPVWVWIVLGVLGLGLVGFAIAYFRKD